MKGGVALELRFAEGARTTKDIDLGGSGLREHRLLTFQHAVALGFDDFTFQVKGKPLNMDKVDAVRLELAIRYRTRAWQTIDVDLGSSGTGAVDLVVPTIRVSFVTELPLTNTESTLRLLKIPFRGIPGAQNCFMVC